MTHANTGFSVSSTVSNSTVTTESPSRQIIFLNTSNQSSSALPLQGTKSTHPSVVLHPTPLVMVPRADANAVSYSSNVTMRPISTDIVQQTSVIMSAKMSDN